MPFFLVSGVADLDTWVQRISGSRVVRGIHFARFMMVSVILIFHVSLITDDIITQHDPGTLDYRFNRVVCWCYSITNGCV